MRSLLTLVVLGSSVVGVGQSPQPIGSNVVLAWNNAALQGIRDTKLGAPMAARVLAIVHTCMYDAWAAYDDRAVGTQLHDALRRPLAERTVANKERAVSYAAYRALTDVLPADDASVYSPLMRRLGYDPSDTTTDIEAPAGIGSVSCAAVLEFRHHDKANQLGDLAPGAYSDWSGYEPANKPSPVPPRLPATDPNRWQPLVYVNATGDLVSQSFLVPQWCFVAPFALIKGGELRETLKPFTPATYGSAEYQRQAQELVDLSANLTDFQKTVAEYWLDGPSSEQPPGHWALFAQWVSKRDRHSLDDDVKMFFLLSNALFDAGVAAWDAKRAYDSVRPATAIPLVFKGQRIRAWGGPGKGTVEIEGSEWIPYQPTIFPTPPFPEFVSGHSTFSAAAASILKSWTRSDRFGYSVTLSAGSSKVEPGITPARPVTLSWQTFTQAADEAGMSRRYGGIHFERGDMAGRLLGRLVAMRVWSKAQAYFNGTASSSFQGQ
jgi:PAP2 superfamily